MGNFSTMVSNMKENPNPTIKSVSGTIHQHKEKDNLCLIGTPHIRRFNVLDERRRRLLQGEGESDGGEGENKNWSDDEGYEEGAEERSVYLALSSVAITATGKHKFDPVGLLRKAGFILPEAEASTTKGNVVLDSPFREVPFPPPLVLSSRVDHRWCDTEMSQSRYEEMENKNITVAMDPIKQCHDDGGNNGRCGEILGEENRHDAEVPRTEGKERQRLRRDPFTSDEIYNMIRTIQDPEHNLTLEQLSIVNVDHIEIYDSITAILDNNDNEKNKDNNMHVDEKKNSINDKDGSNGEDVEMEEKKEEKESCCGGKIVENENVNEKEGGGCCGGTKSNEVNKKEGGGCCGGTKSNEVNTKESEIERRRLERRRGGFSFVDGK